jgi:acyl carrier protein
MELKMSSLQYEKVQLCNVLTGLLAKELRLQPSQVHVDQLLTEYGLDSITAVTIVGELEEQFDIELPETLLWDCPTIDHLAAHIHDMLCVPA